jgi:hypothetical protein
MKLEANFKMICVIYSTINCPETLAKQQKCCLFLAELAIANYTSGTTGYEKNDNIKYAFAVFNT